MIPHYGVAAGITSIHTLVIVDIITICGIAAVIHSASMRNMCIIVITFRYISCRRRNHRTGSTHSGGEHSDQGFPCCSLFHSIIPLKLFFIVVCLLLLWKRSRCVHCVVMRIDTTSSEISGICLSILYHVFAASQLSDLPKNTFINCIHCRNDYANRAEHVIAGRICTCKQAYALPRQRGTRIKKSRGAWRRSPGVRVFALVEIALSV